MPMLRVCLLYVLFLATVARAQGPMPAPAASPSQSQPTGATLTKPPRLKRFIKAEPPIALAERGAVNVVLTIDIDQTGRVRSVTVAKPVGDGFDEAAVKAAEQFEFEPGESNGNPVPVRITYQYRFLFEPPPPAPGRPANEPPKVETVPFAGSLLRKGDRVALGGVTVLVDENGLLTAITTPEGRFSFDAVPLGRHLLHFRGGALAKPFDATLELQPGKRLDNTYYVEGGQRYASTVRGQRVIVETVEQTLSGDEVRRIPGTEGDTLKAVENMPGVARAPFGSGQIVAWGSAQQDSRTYVDGVLGGSLFHFFGLRSTVNSEVVSSLSFYPGGYGVDYSRGLGGVVEIETREPRADGVHGFAQIDLIDASLLVEAKLSKNISLFVGARRSLIDTWLPAVTTNDFQLSPTYYDYQAKLHWRASPNDDVSLFFFGSDDSIKLILNRPDPGLSSQLSSHTFFHHVLVRYQHRWGKVSLTVTPAFGYDVPVQVGSSMGNTNVSYNGSTFGYSVRAVARIPLTNWFRLDAGVDFEGNRWDLSGTAPIAGLPRDGDTNGGGALGFASAANVAYLNNTAPYASLNLRLFSGTLLINPQLRYDFYVFSGYLGSPDHYEHFYPELEPRLAVRYQINKWVALKGSVGVYHQAPDVQSFVKTFGNTSLPPEKGIHYVAGVDSDPTSTLHIELEGFYKDLSRQVVRGEALTDPALVSDGIGRVYGGELLVRQQLFRNFFGWVSYTLSRSERKDHPDQPWRIFEFDQTHILTVIGSYQLPRGYQVGLRFRYVTGNPYTPVIGSYYDATSAQYRPLSGPTYSARLGSFNQLDVRFDKSWTFQRWKLSVYLDIQNVYYSKPPEDITYNFNFTKSQPISGLPVVPALGIRGDF